MTRLKIALIGAGRRGMNHFDVITRMRDHFELVAVCDVRREAAEAAAARVGARAYTGVRDLVDRERLDLCDLVTPGDSHHAVSCFLSRHGVHHIVETPIAATLPLADLMIGAAREHGVRLEVAEEFYRLPEERLMVRVIASGAIGRVGRILRHQDALGYHGTSHLRMLAGNPRPVAVRALGHTMAVEPYTDNADRSHTTEPFRAGFFEFEDGVLGVMMCGNAKSALGRYPRPGYLEIAGSRGAVVRGEVRVVPPENFARGAIAERFPVRREYHEVDGRRVLRTIAVDLPGGTIERANPFADYPIEKEMEIALAEELDSIARALWEDREPEYGAMLAREDHEMGLAMDESVARDGERLTFPLVGPTEAEERIHRQIREETGREPEDVEGLLDVFFPPTYGETQRARVAVR